MDYGKNFGLNGLERFVADVVADVVWQTLSVVDLSCGRPVAEVWQTLLWQTFVYFAAYLQGKRSAKPLPQVCHKKRSATHNFQRSAKRLPHLCHRKVYHNVCHNVCHTGFSIILGFSGPLCTECCHNFIVLIS